MLTATATNAPKKFPSSPDALLKKTQPQPFSKDQWREVIAQLTGGNREKPKRPKYPPRE